MSGLIEKPANLARETVSWVVASFNFTYRWIGGKYGSLLRFIDPDDKNRPRASTVLWSTVCFVVFLFVGGFAIGYPTPGMRIVMLIVNCLIFIIQAALCARDVLYHHRHSIYQRNLTNTTLLFLLTVVTMTVLYQLVWYEGLNLWILETRQERIPSFRFPGIYIIQDNAKFQAHLLDKQPLTCFIGAQDPNGPMCSSLSPEEVLETSTCNCNDSWVPGVLPNFLDGDKKRSLSLLPKENLLTRANVMTIKFNFDYNTSQADPQLGSPNLWLFVYDPTLPFSESYMNGYSSMRLFNAYGSSTVLLDNHYFIDRIGKARYEYGVVISTTPYQSIVCDVAGPLEKYTPCRGVLLLNVPGFDSTKIRERKALLWTDAVAQVGAYFALVQVVSWIVSGAVWGT